MVSLISRDVYFFRINKVKLKYANENQVLIQYWYIMYIKCRFLNKICISLYPAVIIQQSYINNIIDLNIQVQVNYAQNIIKTFLKKNIVYIIIYKT